MKKLQRLTRNTVAALVVAAGGVAGVTSAQAEGLYVGGALGTPDYHSTINGITGDGSGVGGKVFGGWQMNPYFGLEGGLYDLGHIDNDSGKVTTRGVYFDAVGSLPLAQNFSLIGNAGVTSARLKTTFGNDTSPGVKLGVGLQYDLTKTVAVRAQYERYHFTNAFDDKANIGAATLGLKVGF